MSMDEAKRKFAEQVKLRGYDDQFIDLKEENEILTKALDNGFTVESAKASLIVVCNKNGFIVESVLLQEARKMLKQFANNDGVLDKKEFSDTVQIMLNSSNDKLTKRECELKIRNMIIEFNYKVSQGLFRGGNWFNKI